MFGWRKHRSYVTKEGYVQKYKPSSPEARDDGYVAVHRDVASRKIGQPLRSNEVVHHRDGNKRNNRASNLQVMTRKQHWKIHHSK
ncbi:HNH endonuclease signature motif containing protein [Anaerocaecibacter muris]|uniref:HNH endonuclease signature motif containing protein n=1 Tax=Anaerocaecibacter muris TaxID=2941513 RepID=UPI002041BA6C|nr:HNH endonuclease signature motif containing protein [Anaerocaecibacter muris]